MITGDNAIIQNAKEAKEKYESAADKEESNLKKMSQQMEIAMGKMPKVTDSRPGYLEVDK